MSAELDDRLVQLVDDLGSTAWSGTAYRHTTRRRDPLSGEGARRYGGRWNPPDSFPTVYLAQPLATCAAELERLAVAAATKVTSLLPRDLHTIAVRDLPVLDLRDDAALRSVGLSIEDIRDDDWSACQNVGHAAYFLDMAGVIAPSATGAGVVIATFELRIKPGQVEHVTTTTLDEAAYAVARVKDAS